MIDVEMIDMERDMVMDMATWKWEIGIWALGYSTGLAELTTPLLPDSTPDRFDTMGPE